MTNAELIAKGWAMANCEHSDTGDMLCALANALSNAERRIAATVEDLEDLCSMITVYQIWSPQQFRREIHNIRKTLEQS